MQKNLFFIKKIIQSGDGDTQTRRGRGWDSIFHPRWVWVE